MIETLLGGLLGGRLWRAEQCLAQQGATPEQDAGADFKLVAKGDDGHD